jgi:predicted nucleotidyltransferase
MNLRKIKLLKKYFEKEPSVSFAFLLGSQIKDRARAGSDWDVAVYFKPNEYLELEKEANYPNENEIWSDYEAIDFWNFIYDFWKIRERAK